MAKDDYEVVAYKILTYLYACMKGKAAFEKTVFRKSVVGEYVSDEYLHKILRLMQNDSLIEGLTFVRAWGNEWVLASDFSDASITAEGIRYLKDNSKTDAIKKAVLESAGLIAGLIQLLGL